MEMKRRTFLKVLAAGTFSLATGIGLRDVGQTIVKGEPLIASGADWIVTAAGDIKYVGPSDRTWTVLDLHRWLMEVWDEPAQMDLDAPSEAVTSHIIRLKEGFRIEENSIRHLSNGSIVEDDTGSILSGIVSVGAIPETRIVVEQDGEQIIKAETEVKGHINALVPTKKEGRWIDEGRLVVRARDHRSDPFIIEARGPGVNVFPMPVIPWKKL